MSRSVLYTSSPLLASKTPVWRSKFIVAGFALIFAALAARAAYIQIYANDFFQRQGEVRFARTLALPANRGRILDRNGLILASSVPASSIWAIPEDVDATPTQLAKLARLLEMPLAELKKKLDDDRNFVWIKRQLEEPVARKIHELDIPGIYQRRDHLAAAAVDLIVTQLSQHEHGVPDVPRQIMIPPQWVEGPSVRALRHPSS